MLSAHARMFPTGIDTPMTRTGIFAFSSLLRTIGTLQGSFRPTLARDTQNVASTDIRRSCIGDVWASFFQGKLANLLQSLSGSITAGSSHIITVEDNIRDDIDPDGEFKLACGEEACVAVVGRCEAEGKGEIVRGGAGFGDGGCGVAEEVWYRG